MFDFKNLWSSMTWANILPKGYYKSNSNRTDSEADNKHGTKRMLRKKMGVNPYN